MIVKLNIGRYTNDTINVEHMFYVLNTEEGHSYFCLASFSNFLPISHFLLTIHRIFPSVDT